MGESKDPFRDRLFAFLAAGSGGAVQALEVGCGDGEASRILRDHLFHRHDHSATRLYLLDLAVAKVAAAQGLCGKAEGSRTRGLAGDLYTLPFPDAAFDYLFAFNVLYWVRRRAFFQEAHRVLRPAGRMLTCDRLPKQLAAPVPFVFWEMTSSRLLELAGRRAS